MERVGLSVPEAAKVAGVSEEQIRGWVRAGKLTNFGSRRVFRVSRFEIERLMGASETTVEQFRQALEPVVRYAVRQELRAIFARAAGREVG